MKIINGKLSFEDVLIAPRPSELSSRSEVNLEVSYICKHSRSRFSGVPVCVANMDTIGQIGVAKSLYKHKIWVALHKFIETNDIYNFLREPESEYCFVTIGSSNFEKEIEKLKFVFENFKTPPKICIDAANAYMYSFLDVVKKVRDIFPTSILMAGNVCTPEGVENIIKAGADIAKSGIANGGFCDTKNKAGVGYKQFSVALECGQAANELNALCCSDGGCKMPADICKALGAGSHLVMAGSIFGGCEESEGEWQYDEKGNKKAIKFYGMSSESANKKYFGGLKKYRASEGKEGFVPFKGSIEDVAIDIKGSLASCCTYTNTKNLENLYKNCFFTTS